MDQKTVNEILGTLGGLSAQVKALLDASARTTVQIDEMKTALSSRVHNVNNELTVLKGSVSNLTRRFDDIEPTIEVLKEHHLRTSGAMAVGRVVWLFVVSAITATITAVVTVIAQHYLHA